MNAAKQAVWMFFAIIALACSGWYFASKPQAKRLDAQTLANTEDTIVTNIVISQYNNKGQLVNRLASPTMKHIPEQNTHLLTHPHILIIEENQPAWEIDAASATGIDGGKQITFKKEVVIHQQAGEHNLENTFKTEELLYFPKQKYATTELPVFFSQPGSTMHAQGMHAWLNEKHIELLSNTRITYEPAKQQHKTA